MGFKPARVEKTPTNMVTFYQHLRNSGSKPRGTTNNTEQLLVHCMGQPKSNPLVNILITIRWPQLGGATPHFLVTAHMFKLARLFKHDP